MKINNSSLQDDYAIYLVIPNSFNKSHTARVLLKSNSLNQPQLVNHRSPAMSSQSSWLIDCLLILNEVTHMSSP